jgi:hypothetical protein
MESYYQPDSSEESQENYEENSSIGSSVEDPNPTFKKVHSSYVCFLLDYFLICEPLCGVPQDINLDPSARSAPVDAESPKVDKC